MLAISSVSANGGILRILNEKGLDNNDKKTLIRRYFEFLAKHPVKLNVDDARLVFEAMASGRVFTSIGELRGEVKVKKSRGGRRKASDGVEAVKSFFKRMLTPGERVEVNIADQQLELGITIPGGKRRKASKFFTKEHLESVERSDTHKKRKADVVISTCMTVFVFLLRSNLCLP